MPHGHCYLWEPGLVVLHVGSDLLIGLAIALTAYAQDGVRQKVFAAGFQGFLTKPAGSQALLGEIARLIKD